MLERYSFEFQRAIGPPTWVVDIFLSLAVPHETLVATLEAMFYNDEIPFTGRNRRYVSSDLLHVLGRWYAESAAQGGRAAVFGGEENVAAVGEMLGVLMREGGLEGPEVEECRVLRERVEVLLR